MILVPLYSAIASRVSRVKLINFVTTFFIVCLLGFFLWAQSLHVPSRVPKKSHAGQSAKPGAGAPPPGRDTARVGGTAPGAAAPGATAPGSAAPPAAPATPAASAAAAGY